MNFRMSASYERYGSIKLVAKIKFHSGEWAFLHPLDRLVCMHHPRVNEIYSFRKFRVNHKILLKAEEFKRFYTIDPVTGQPGLANGRPSLTDEQYHQQYPIISPEIAAVYAHHAAHCAQCKYWKVKTKTIRKRKKLTASEREHLAFDIGESKVPISSLATSYNITERTVLEIKRKLRIRKNKQPRRTWRFSCISPYQQSRILESVHLDGYQTLPELKQRLKLNCDCYTLRNFLRSHGIRPHSVPDEVLVSDFHWNNKVRFANLMADVRQEVIDTFIFCDEKTIQNHYNGRLRVYRKRGSRHRSRWRFRRNPQTSIKANLFGFITSAGVGDIFVFSNKTNSVLFVNYFMNSILPAIVNRVGTNFVLVADNAPFHKSNLTYELFLRLNLPLLAWPALSPELNLIENV